MISKTKRKCNLLVSRKIQKLIKEGVMQKVAVARAILYVKKTHPECIKYFKR